MTVYLNFATINDSDIIKKIGEKSNTETKNNTTIDTEGEWKSFLSNIVSAFCAGDITYEIAKKYIGESSSIFEKQNQYNQAFTSSIKESIDELHDKNNTRIARKIYNFFEPNTPNEVMHWAGIMGELARDKERKNIAYNQ